MNILFNDFKKQYELYRGEYDTAIRDVLESGHYILGDRVAEFERKFSGYIGMPFAVGVGNGFDAIHIGLMALGIGAGDEVITTAHTAAATANAIEFVGASCVFVDVDDYYHLDPSQIEKKITPRTKAILVVHIYGQSADIDAIQSIAENHNLYIIEDCAQAHGAEYKGKKLGSFGDVSCFSFYPTKNLGAFGDAGLIMIKDREVYEKSLMIRNYGQKNRYEHEILGLNSRLDEMQAAILLVQLSHLDEFNEKRRNIAQQYSKRLAALDTVHLPKVRGDSKHIFHLFVIDANRRDELKTFLGERGIPALIHYPIPLHKQKSFQKYANVFLPNLEDKVDRILSLPIHPFLSVEEVDFVCATIIEFYIT